MNRLILQALAVMICHGLVVAQTPSATPAATEIIQPSTKLQESVSSVTVPQTTEQVSIKLPAGTPIEVESAYTVSSLDVRPGELLTFRVLVPVMVNGVVAIETGALVTARVTVAKRGGHWGKAGRLSWTMVDVVAVDNSRIPLAPQISVRNPAWVLLKETGKDKKVEGGAGSIKGTSHKGEVATRTVIAAAIFPPLAPLALMNGFKRGENAVLPEGKRFVVVVKDESLVKPRD
ncbi:MAG TPA: hypothetical protein VJU86_02890 [Pyrinomonadaceae bacterium]|nr:hypothetical protein [Pyrinomonadaceae bacterium]